VFGLYEPIVFRMRPDPDPQHATLEFHRERSMVQADTRRPELSELFEVQGRMS
jgi:hypothetical protein